MASAVTQDRRDGKKRREITDGGLCHGCLWDCVQPLGVTVACPEWRPRGQDEPRRNRNGQQQFAFAKSGKT